MGETKLFGENKEKFYGEGGIGFGRKGSNFKDRTTRFIEKATEMTALESMWFIGKKQIILLLGIVDHKSLYCGRP